MAKNPNENRKIEVDASINELIAEMAKNYKPRDPARIDRILDAIGELWKMQPDTRFGQLLMNFCFRDRENLIHISPEILAIYEQEDDVSLTNLQKKLDEERVKTCDSSS